MPRRLILVVLGKQGSGKGTQCARLSARFGLPHVSTGDILRAAVKAGTPLGQRVKAVMDAGDLVSDDLVNDLVAERLGQRDAADGVLLDGFPRTLAQAEALEALLAPGGVSLCVDLEAPLALVVERLSQRRVCTECGTIYGAADASSASGVCAKCGGSVVQRDDDRPEAIAQRLATYERDTAPLLDFYRARGLLVGVDATRRPDEVTEDLVAVLTQRGLV
jgi:adenylate kinase